MHIGEIDTLSESEFSDLLGGVYEHSPWVAEAVVGQRPFGSFEALRAAFVDAVSRATETQKHKLLCAHPDLAGRLAEVGELTAESTSEQLAAGLDGIDPETQAQLNVLNEKYRSKFGFPFIICARLNKVEMILKAMQKRLPNTIEQEFEEALAQVDLIAELRLRDLID